MTVNTQGVWHYGHETPRCEHCNSTTLTSQGSIYVNGSPQSVYSCQNGHATTGITSWQKQLLDNNANNGTTTWVSSQAGIAGGTLGGLNQQTYVGGLGPGVLETKMEALRLEQARHTEELRLLNSNFNRLSNNLEKLLAKIDEAKLTDPLAALHNRIKNFELK